MHTKCETFRSSAVTSLTSASTHTANSTLAAQTKSLVLPFQRRSCRTLRASCCCTRTHVYETMALTRSRGKLLFAARVPKEAHTNRPHAHGAALPSKRQKAHAALTWQRRR